MYEKQIGPFPCSTPQHTATFYLTRWMDRSFSRYTTSVFSFDWQSIKGFLFFSNLLFYCYFLFLYFYQLILGCNWSKLSKYKSIVLLVSITPKQPNTMF